MKITRIILIILLITVIAAVSFVRNLNRRALPDYNQDIQLKGLYEPVEVYRDKYAIPHIYAQNEHDLYMAVGYTMAGDRLWQMDMLRRVTEGRLSEIFGKDYVETDFLLRALRFSKKSEKILAQTDSIVLLALNAYAEGVNQYIEQHQKELPPEFTILGYKPDPWLPKHTVNMIGYMGWDLKAGWSEIILEKLKKTVDSLHYNQLIPNLMNEKEVVYPNYDSNRNIAGILPDLLLNTAGLLELGADVLEASNNWAVSGAKSTTGMPLLANDMHLSLSIPGIWYQMHQVVEGKLNVTGLGLPCTPVIVCGHNDSIAWGMTNTYVDNVDFYEETISSDNPEQYKYDGKWLSMDTLTIVIRTSDDEQFERMLRFTHRGPVVSPFKDFGDKVVSMHWVGEEMSDEFLTVMLLNRANNWDDFKNALKTFTSISQNIVYADKKGNIGLFCAAGVPIRKRDIKPGSILPGDTSEYDWQGYVPFEELPYQYNPASNYVASANNKTVDESYPWHIGTWYSLPDRFRRITEMMTSKEKLSVDDFIEIQLDQYSKLAEDYMPVFLKALDQCTNMSSNEAKAYSYLVNWDYVMGPREVAPAVFETMYLKVIRNVFEDELGEPLFENMNGVNSVTRRAIYEILTENSESVWVDDINTMDVKEGMNEILISAFKDAIEDLEEKAGNKPEKWEWGMIHNIELEHPLSAVKILDMVFKLNRGPYSVGGSFHTVSPYSYNSNEPFAANHGASHRHIFDLNEWDNSITVIPTGNSGLPASKHYCDQTVLYLNGEYHRDYFSRDAIISNQVYHMSFLP